MAGLAEWIAQRREILENSTEAPWIAEYSGVTGNCVLPHDAEDAREALALTRGFYAAWDAALIADGRSALPLALDAIEAVLAEHRDEGASQGYFGDPAPYDYGERAHCCSTCGTHGEYGVEWPCPTVRAIATALGVEP